MRHDELRRLVDECLMFLQESAHYQSDLRFKDVLAAAREPVAAIRHRLERAVTHYTVAVVGLTNVGKSTLLNALLGDRLAPERNGPCTALPIEFAYGETIQVTAESEAGFRPRRSGPLRMTEVREILETFVNNASADGSNRVCRIVVHLPHALLQYGLALVDTPGFGAPQENGAPHPHECVLLGYLKQQVSQVFWVTLGEQGIGRREADFHQEHLAAVCDDVVVTGCEDWDEQDRRRYKRRFASLFEHRIPQFHFVSGQEQHGQLSLQERIRQLARPSDRLAAAQSALQELLVDLGEWARIEAEERNCARVELWRPDSWRRLVALGSVLDVRANLIQSMG